VPDPIQTTFSAGTAVATLRLNRPDSMNAVSPDVLTAFGVALDAVEAAGARICVIAGSGRAFSAGADLQGLLDLSDTETEAYIRVGCALMDRLERGPLITIAAVAGYALGGGAEIALACNLCVASPQARFGLPEVLVGTFPGWGGVARLVRTAPRALALDVLMSARRLGPEEALAAGIVSALADDAEQGAAEIAERLLAAAPAAQLAVRDLATEITDLPLDEGIERSNALWLELMRSSERIEGHMAFVEKRTPGWVHRGE
jgi:enoyl-CoA hydratase/carnithine racemase